MWYVEPTVGVLAFASTEATARFPHLMVADTSVPKVGATYHKIFNSVVMIYTLKRRKRCLYKHVVYFYLILCDINVFVFVFISQEALRYLMATIQGRT